jgi:Mg2+ and Co2+ transporter CorA
MIKDISKIREYLEGYVEVEMPYEFEKNSGIQYITCELDGEGNISCESFYPNCKFIRRCNDILIINHNNLTKKVPICRRSKDGVVTYQSRFYIPDKPDNELNELNECKENTHELKETIKYQQEIIEKSVERIKTLEIDKHEMYDKNSTYEQLLQEGRYKLKELSILNREMKEKIDHYEELIPKLYNSR